MEIFITVIVLALLFSFLNERKFKIKEFIINVVIYSVLYFLVRFIGNYLHKHVHFSIPLVDRIPEVFKVWFGGLLFFILCCGYSIKGWREFNKQKKNEIK
ncbi:MULTISPECIES: hypothetical protein [Bacillaceae]|uniref:Uncharacterized protein n=1 Tax=Gottfriedia luciferensis TaxID=178774 RepID=A0ABX2ZTV6_9BACI|nr:MULTISPECIES: hypothetical protein [Bacillaceae]ODG93230.1 hypothetical protein BED47_02790 [Gottfriedia luciferensis]PGZ95118.1 hypothetical protein COE53_00740 [Bacillus sp. AFS029533]